MNFFATKFLYLISTKQKFVAGVIFSFLLCFLAPATPVFAHFLKTDGSIGAVLHIDPDDDPIAGSQSGFFFEFKDKANKFSPDKCDCTFLIIEDGKQIFSQPLFANNASPSLTSASVFYTFPERNVYQIKVVGKPQTPGAFQPFTLVYDVRVARTFDNSAQGSTNISLPSWLTVHWPHFILAGIGTIFVIFATIKQQLSKRKNVK